MLFDPMYFAKQALWFWSVMLEGFLADLTPPKPVLSVVQGGRK